MQDAPSTPSVMQTAKKSAGLPTLTETTYLLTQIEGVSLYSL